MASLDLQPDWLCISPGPKAPDQAGISKAAIAHFYRRSPSWALLGAPGPERIFGGVTVKAPVPVHGKRHLVFHQGQGVFKGSAFTFRGRPLPLPHGRAPLPGPGSYRPDRDGVIMGLQHRQFPLHGVQFHPESFLTDHGHALAANFLGCDGQVVAERV